jgi:hypothetical protein
MFRVLVLGGIALTTSGAAASAQGCGGSIQAASDAGFDASGFPSETAGYFDAGASVDARHDAPADAPTADAPTDAGNAPDANDASAAPDVHFPQETALPPDAAFGG